VKVKYAFICGEEGNYPIAKMCGWAKVSRSGYYAWHDRGPAPSELRRRECRSMVRAVSIASALKPSVRRLYTLSEPIGSVAVRASRTLRTLRMPI
jgi:hypothetical protein